MLPSKRLISPAFPLLQPQSTFTSVAREDNEGRNLAVSGFTWGMMPFISPNGSPILFFWPMAVATPVG
jgi:hypothetical protein